MKELEKLSKNIKPDEYILYKKEDGSKIRYWGSGRIETTTGYKKTKGV